MNRATYLFKKYKSDSSAIQKEHQEAEMRYVQGMTISNGTNS